MIRKQTARNLAYMWYSGQRDPLYAFASTGCIQSEEHRRDCIHNINLDLKSSVISKKEVTELQKLKDYLEQANIEVC